VDLLLDGLRQAVLLVVSGDPELGRIAALSLAVSGFATALATVCGIPLGAALAIGRFPGRRPLQVTVNAGMGLPPVVVGLVVSIFLWRTGPFGSLRLLFTPQAMVIAQFLVALPIVAGLTRVTLGLVDREVLHALRVDGAGEARVARELVWSVAPQMLVVVAAAFGRAISEVGASLMVGGNLQGQTRILTTAITLETSKGEFAQAIALGLVLLGLALLVNVALSWRERLLTVR
jgi:ABC-type tungstate transport system substrate-binding protein